jgi:hypothetical protein
MPEQRGLDNYASPILRAAVFRRLFPGAQVSYKVVPIGDAFPVGHTDYEGKASEAIRCEIVLADGTYVVAHKEIDKAERGRNRTQTPEELAKDETKALGRALRDLGIPQRLTELKILMQWIVDMDGNVPLSSGGVTVARTAALSVSSDDIDDSDDSADAGAEDPTVEQMVAMRFSQLNGASKAAVSKHARDTLGVANVMRAGEHADALLDYIDKKSWLAEQGITATEDPEEPF